MDINGFKRKLHPKENAGYLSLLTFSYMLKLYHKCFKRSLRQDDLYAMPKNLETRYSRQEFERAVHREKMFATNPTLLRIIWARYKWEYALIMLPCLMMKILRSIYEPQLVSNYISYFKENQTNVTLEDTIFYTVALIVLTVIYSFVISQFYIYRLEFSVKIKCAISSLIFRKSLKLSHQAIQDANVGNIVTLLTKDVAIFENGLVFVMDLFISSVQVVSTCFTIYRKIGYTASFGILCFGLIITLQLSLGRYITKLRVFIDNKTSQRIKATQEALASLKVIKMLCWENYFLKKILNIRKIEVNNMLKDAYAKSLIIVLGSLCSDLMIFIMIMSNVWLGLPLVAENVFYIITGIRSIRLTVAIVMSLALGYISDFNGSKLRIQKVLDAEELDTRLDEFTDEPKIFLRNVRVTIKDKEVLTRLSVSIKPGIICIQGSLGSGKTTLLMTILKEYPYEGHVLTKGRLSFASQNPWLFPSTIKNNIIFEEDFNGTRYERVLQMCALKNDLKRMKDGDETLVINNGLNLSKGQQARINLARALYRDCEIYLLDDCFSVLDSNVQGHILQEFTNGFFKDKICLAVTENRGFMGNCDKILCLDGGGLKYFDTPGDFLVYENDYYTTKDSEVSYNNGDEDDLDDIVGDQRSLLGVRNFYKEVQKEGYVAPDVYWKYIRYGRGLLIFIGIVVFFCLSEFFEGYSTKALTKWVDKEQKRFLTDKNTTLFQELTTQSDSAIQLYTGLMITSVLITLLKVTTFFDFAKSASIKINKDLTHKLMTTALSFFSNNFLGSILNVFSQDLNNIDEHLPFMFMNLLKGVITTVAIIIIIFLVNWQLVLLALMVLISVIFIREFYAPTARCLKRFETSRRSPFVGLINSSIEGLTTIRAHNAQDHQTNQFEDYHDLFAVVYYTLYIAEISFYFFVDNLCIIFISVFLWLFLFILNGVSAGNVGLAIIYIFAVRPTVTHTVKASTSTEMYMTSVERVIEYTKQKPESDKGLVVDNWPSKGSIVFENVSLSYNKQEPILNKINFTIKPREKIGIVGRTGSGKSSMVSLIFRLFEYEGKILIDDLDIKTLKLEQLRSSIDIIPQDPILFTDTVRNNLDPLSKYNDEALWTAISKLNLHSLLPDLTQQISPCQFSEGEKQLICLARVMLTKNRILIMDEATANVDFGTEKYLLSLIEEHFQEYTVLNIVHKRHCLENYDRVFILDNGEIKEFKD